MLIPPIALRLRIVCAMTGVGASRLQSTGLRPLAASTSAAAREHSRPRKRVSWPSITRGLRLKFGDFGFRPSALRKSAIPWVARRTLSNVKSRAISPRQPLVPNLMSARFKVLALEDSALPVERLLFQGVE